MKFSEKEQQEYDNFAFRKSIRVPLGFKFSVGKREFQVVGVRPKARHKWFYVNDLAEDKRFICSLEYITNLPPN